MACCATDRETWLSIDLGFSETASMAENTHQAQKDNTEALRRNEATYRAIAQSFPNGAIYVFDRDLRYEVVEGELLTALGQTPAALEGKTIREIFDPDTLRTIEPRY